MHHIIIFQKINKKKKVKREILTSDILLEKRKDKDLNTCPITDVTLKCAGDPRNLSSNS